MPDAPRLLTPSEVDAHLWTLQRGGHLTQGTYIAALHALRAAWGDKKFYQDGWVRADESLDEMRKDLDAARAALRVALGLASMAVSAASIGLSADDIAQKLSEALRDFAPEARAALGEPAGQP